MNGSQKYTLGSIRGQFVVQKYSIDSLAMTLGDLLKTLCIIIANAAIQLSSNFLLVDKGWLTYSNLLVGVTASGFFNADRSWDLRKAKQRSLSRR